VADPATEISVQAEDFDAGAELARLTRGRPGIGGLACFIGLVRDLHGDQPVTALTLEHYPGMTEREIAAIIAEARGRWPLDAIRVIHRIGRLTPGDRIVLVATAGAHREAAFDACRFIMDFLKTRAPFWKYEEGPGGGAWVEAKAGDEAAAAAWKATP
jgi:molybdopterin synthase catalytic subunit